MIFRHDLGSRGLALLIVRQTSCGANFGDGPVTDSYESWASPCQTAHAQLEIDQA
jgi:hypothetical protein